MFITFEGVRRAEHHEDGKHVPLQFEPAIRTVTERVADHRVGRAHDTRSQHQKIADVTYLLIDQVDGCANRQQWTHRIFPGGRH